MFANLGVNVDPKNPAGKPSSAALGPFGWIRLVARWDKDANEPDQSIVSYVAEARAAGTRVLLVLARESFRTGTPNTSELRAVSRGYGERIDADGYQICNEPDAGWNPSFSTERNSAVKRGPDHPSSWCMDPGDFAETVGICAQAIREARPTAVIVTAGLTSGSAEYLARCGPLPVDGVAIHPYGQRPEPDRSAWEELPGNFGFVGNLLDSYRMFGLPLWVSEIGVSSDPEQSTPEFQARYCRAMMSHLRDRNDIVAAIWFCYSDGMVPEFGLLDRHGAPKPAFHTFPQ